MNAHRRVLIANRGEIAIRIARAADALGMESVAVYPPADALVLHLHFATRAHQLKGVDDPVSAYLNAGLLVAAALENDCDCLHPGYGFLSESSTLAQQCASAGITFVGPSPDALALFGDKVRARALAESLSIPVVPGSVEPLASAEAASAMAATLGYPVMIKASAGGGGRGMRAVTHASDLPDAFERCRSEAEAAFGNGALFLERLVARPRHIEVQILADSFGTTIHLHDRDCSVQIRNQKVIEIAPAPSLDPGLRDRILTDAVRLVRAANYVNAGTVEFLVCPETGEYFFIECNPRIQVEHTVTEQVTGVDLVEAQFRIAAGATLESLELGDQQAVGQPRGFAVQARVVAQGMGTITAYKEPSGPGLRVDACGYVGYAPPPQFDPLLAKVIGSSNSSLSLTSALDRTSRALQHFHIEGIATNLEALCAILANTDVRDGNARTTLLSEQPELLVPGGGDRTAAASTGGRSLDFLTAQAAGVRGDAAGTSGAKGATRQPTGPMLEAGEGQRVLISPLQSRVVECRCAVGDNVTEGQTLFVLSAMKMETVLTAPCSGLVAAMVDLQPGDVVHTDTVLLVITEGKGASDGDVTSTARVTSPEESWAGVLDDVQSLRQLAAARLAPGSTDPGVVRQRNRNKLTCRERIGLILDAGSFREVGSLAGFVSYNGDGSIDAFTPANHVGGSGTIESRPAIVCADDFTSRGGHSDGAIGAKSLYLDRLSVELRVPSVRMLDGSSGGGSVASMVPEQKAEGQSNAKESSGAITAGRPRVSGGGGSFLPGHLGSSDYTEQLYTVPVVNMLLGSVVGLGAAKAVLGHFSVMLRDTAQLFVAGPPVVAHAMGTRSRRKTSVAGTSTAGTGRLTIWLRRKRKPSAWRADSCRTFLRASTRHLPF